MGIEIRPGAVSGQIGRKSALLGEMLGEISLRKSAVHGFTGEAYLQGAGADAEKARMSAYTQVFAGIEYSIAATRSADQAVEGALGRFGGQPVVSEDEQLRLRREAGEGMGRAQSMLSMLKSQPGYGEDSSLTRTADALAASSRGSSYQMEAADEMLSRIYSYCGETNNAHAAAVDEVNAAVAKGIAALAATAGRASWGALDTGWLGELCSAVARSAGLPAIGGAGDFYDGRGVNERNCRAYMGVPFELWGPDAAKAMAEAYDRMWSGEGGMPDTEAIKRLICCAYVDGREGAYAIDPERPGDTTPKYERVLTNAFKQFSGYYAGDAMGRGAQGMALDQLMLKSGFLLDVSMCMASVWITEKGRDPAFTIGYMTNDQVGRGNNDVFCMSLSTMSLYGERLSESATLGMIAGAGDPVAFLTDIEKTYLERLKVDVLGDPARAGLTDAVLGTLGLLLTAAWPLDMLVSAGSFYYNYNAGLETNATVDSIADMSRMKTVVGYTWLDGSASLVNGGAVLHQAGVNEELLRLHVKKYNAGKTTDVQVSAEQVKEFIEAGGSLSDAGDPLRAFLSSTEPKMKKEA